MSAAEIIEQIKALPLDEQREVFAFVHAKEALTRPQEVGEETQQPAKPEQIESVAARIFDRYDPLFRKLAE